MSITGLHKVLGILMLLVISTLTAAEARSETQGNGERMLRLGPIGKVKKGDGKVTLTAEKGLVSITAISDAVLRVRMTTADKFGQAEERFLVNRPAEKTEFTVQDKRNTLTVSVAALQLYIDKKTGSLTLTNKDGKTLFSEHGKGLRLGQDGKGYEMELTLRKDEHIFGHGDVVGPLDHREMKNIKMKVEYRPRNVCMPFFMSTAGYGLFLNDPSQTLRFDYYGEKPDGYQSASCKDGQFDCFLIGGSNLKEIQGNFTGAVAGRAPLVPRYALGVMWSLKSNCQFAEAMKVAKAFREKDLPMDSFQFEPGPGYKAYIPKQKGKTEKETLDALTAMNYHVAVWNGRAPNFWEDNKNWVEWGVDWIKVDPCHRDYKNNLSHDLDARKQMQDFIKLTKGNRPFISDCAGSLGVFQHPSIRMCDRAGRPSVFQSMLSASMTGLPYFFCDFWGTDKAGWYKGCPDPRQNIWGRETIPHNLFLPTVNGQSWSYTYLKGFPWEQGEEWMNSYRYYAKLRYRMLPYYYSCAAACSFDTGVPMTRALALEFDQDPKTYTIDIDQFMFGDSLLVATIYPNQGGKRSVYLPAGETWIDYWTGEKYEGGQTVELNVPEKGPVHLCGLYIRAGAIIPLGPEITWIGDKAEKPDTILLDIYPHGESAFTLYEDDGKTMAYKKGEYCRTKISCSANIDTTSLLIEEREGKYVPGKRSYLVKFNGNFKPLEVSSNGDELPRHDDYEKLLQAESGWFIGKGAPLINGPEGFVLSARDDTIWVKIPDSGETTDVVLRTTQ